MNLSTNLLRGMIESNLEQSLEMLDAGHPTVAIGHLQEAITQIELSQDVAKSLSVPVSPCSSQPTLDV